MAASSTYIQLSSSVLLEYEYRNQGGTANEFTTDVAPWLLMNNGHDSSIAIFNDDQQTNRTGNVRTRMGTPTDVTTAQYGYLQLDQLTTLNDYDPQLTDTVDLPVGFTATQVVSYDVVRLHLVQGFNFENYEGFQFRLGFDNNNGNRVRHLNLAYQKSDNYAQINPEPFIFGGKYYASYIEIKVPALYNLQDEYWSAVFNGNPVNDLPSYKLSGNSGPERNGLINADFAWIVSEKTINGQEYFYSYDFKSVDLPTLDEFSTLSAVVQSATDGDYIELYAAADGNIIENFILNLNDAPDNDYIILHELNVFEYIWPAGGTTTWVQTGNLEFVQDTNYDDPIPYRPIIQNPASVAYRLDYTVRLFNREDSSSIWKSASVQFNDAAKYSKYLRRINLGTNPIQPKVYNQVIDKNVNFFGNNNTSSDIANTTGYTKFVTSFLQSNNVVLSSENAFIQRNPTTGQVQITSVGNSQSEIIYAQGLSKINLTNSDTFIKFVIYKGDPTSSVSFMDLTGLGKINLNFFADSGEITKISKFNSPEISEANGEVLFKIPQKDSQRISQYTNRSYTITSNNGDAESQLYAGTFIPVGEQTDSLLQRKIDSLEKELEEKNNQNSLLEESLALEQTSVDRLKQANKEQNTKIQDLQKALNQQIEENNQLIADDELDEAEKERLRLQIADLNEVQASLQSELQTAQDSAALTASNSRIGKKLIRLDANCPTQFIKPKGQNPRKIATSPFTS